MKRQQVRPHTTKAPPIRKTRLRGIRLDSCPTDDIPRDKPIIAIENTRLVELRSQPNSASSGGIKTDHAYMMPYMSMVITPTIRIT